MKTLKIGSRKRGQNRGDVALRGPVRGMWPSVGGEAPGALGSRPYPRAAHQPPLDLSLCAAPAPAGSQWCPRRRGRPGSCLGVPAAGPAHTDTLRRGGPQGSTALRPPPRDVLSLGLVLPRPWASPRGDALGPARRNHLPGGEAIKQPEQLPSIPGAGEPGFRG